MPNAKQVERVSALQMPSLATKPTVPLKSPSKKQKKFVSTSALFTQKHYALPKPAATRLTSIRATRPAGITKTAPGAGRGSILKKAALTSRKRAEHPLSVAFNGKYHSLVPWCPPLTASSSEATTSYREGVASSATEAIAIAHSNLQARLADPAPQDSQSLASATGPGSAALRAAVAKQLMQLSAPLADELLKISNTSADGTTTETSCRLGASIATFQARVLKEEKTLKVLKKQWAAVQHEILALGTEVLGPGWLVDVFGADNNAAIAMAAQSCGSVAESTQSLQALELETKAKTSALREEIGTASEELLEKLEAGERALDAQRKEHRRAVLAYMQTQL
ncbi:hypothetical protein B0A49_01330 [Cryomyces minteri]|uniref:Uncharacterized protein n=1 Tax=Cryomyces minteri TaxID=331657 RepID=A0A4U0XTT2_9PEZI|nr:hypothetical protein B0A49_01330 [Cryomyces minteri]